MLEFRKKYLELNNIPCSDKRTDAAKFLIKNPNAKIGGKHKYINLIKEFKKLMNNKTKIEDFFAIGDGFTKLKYITDEHGLKDGITLIKKHKNIGGNTLIILNRKAVEFAKIEAKQDREKTVKTLQQKKCLLLEIENV